MIGSRSKISSKGQVTVPVEIRRLLGVKAGDRIEFLSEQGEIVVKPVHEVENPFAKYIGALSPGQPKGHANAWERSMREDDESL